MAILNKGTLGGNTIGGNPGNHGYTDYNKAKSVAGLIANATGLTASKNATVQNIINSQQKPTTSASGSDSGGGGGYDYYSSLLAQFEKQAQDARDAAIAAIMKQLEATKGTYNNQIDDVKAQYRRLIDENEVKKYQARRVVRENQANRGQLNSGLGRQEQLNLNVGYDKQTSNLNSSRTRAVNDIMNLITQAEAEAENQKANIMSNYANQLLQLRLATL